MPNHVYSTLHVAGETESVKQFVQQTMQADNLMEYLLPLDPSASVEIKLPNGETMSAFAQAERDGVDGWRMALDLWGSKWATYEWEWLESLTIDGDHAVAEGRFTTAWGEAEAGWTRISQMFPSLSFVTSAVEEQPAFAIVRIYHKGSDLLLAALDCEGGPSYPEDDSGDAYDEWDCAFTEWENGIKDEARSLAHTAAMAARKEVDA